MASSPQHQAPIYAFILFTIFFIIFIDIYLISTLPVAFALSHCVMSGHCIQNPFNFISELKKVRPGGLNSAVEAGFNQQLLCPGLLRGDFIPLCGFSLLDYVKERLMMTMTF